MITVTPWDAPLGADVTGLDLAGGIGPDELAQVLEAFYRHRVVVMPGQRLGAADFAAFAGWLGRPQLHILKHLRHPEHPEILPLSNVFRDGKPIGVYDGAAYWHTDMSYEEEPAGATVVYALQVPERGGETRFADMVAAYEALPEATRAEIDALQVLHHYGNRADPDEDSRTSASKLEGDEAMAVRNVFHPLVRAHPVTGRKALFAVSGSSFGIVGMPDQEAHALLDRLTRHATAKAYTASHRYAVGDLLMWDNAATLHAATLIEPATGPADTRLLHRISVKGLPAILAGA